MDDFKPKEYIASIEKIYPLKNDIYEYLIKLNVSGKVIGDIILAVDEAITNIIFHAYKDIDDGIITLFIEKNDKEIKIILEDNGHSFNSSKIPRPDVKLNLAGKRRGGFGVYLMRSLMDKVDFKNNKKINQTVLIKKL